MGNILLPQIQLKRILIGSSIFIYICGIGFIIMCNQESGGVFSRLSQVDYYIRFYGYILGGFLILTGLTGAVSYYTKSIVALTLFQIILITFIIIFAIAFFTFNVEEEELYSYMRSMCTGGGTPVLQLGTIKDITDNIYYIIEKPNKAIFCNETDCLCPFSSMIQECIYQDQQKMFYNLTYNDANLYFLGYMEETGSCSGLCFNFTRYYFSGLSGVPKSNCLIWFLAQIRILRGPIIVISILVIIVSIFLIIVSCFLCRIKKGKESVQRGSEKLANLELDKDKDKNKNTKITEKLLPETAKEEFY